MKSRITPFTKNRKTPPLIMPPTNFFSLAGKSRHPLAKALKVVFE
jgi:hypothetical protein